MQTLRLGDRGAEIKELQQLLTKHLLLSPGLTADGVFGPKTHTAVQEFQAAKGLGIDGIAGPRRWAALQSNAAVRTPIVAPIVTTSAPWMAVAQKELGVREFRGAQHNPRIIQYHATTTFKATADEVAWCASFVNWCLIKAGFAGTNSAAAASYVNWGTPMASMNGGVTVIYNPKVAQSSLTASGNHVGFLVRDTAAAFELLGGNQSDQVKVSRYPKASWTLKGCRWPIEKLSS